MKILELYSGIGGMHTAFKMSQRTGEVLCSIDINQTANKVYAHNFPSTNLINGNIQGLTIKKINKMNIDTILMSPPCQPFTRNGLQLDILDPRTNSCVYIFDILPELNVKRLLLENVKGFEQSELHQRLIQALTECGFHYKEFLLTPSQFGVPNSRMRYYCVAKKEAFDEELVKHLPTSESDVMINPFKLEAILEEDVNNEEVMVPMKELVKRCKLLDIIYEDSTRSCCFTKSYGRYIEGTGSVFTPKTRADVDNVYQSLEEAVQEEDENLRRGKMEDLLRTLQFRFFTPREVCRLMSFPEEFGFPDDVKNRQRYMLLGNSINCKVVSELIKLL